jgi:lipopolysaccharide/colanic/teichoic acid biosynthesis glycosyltransferase
MGDSDTLCEEDFVSRLGLERRRTERSSRRFVLVLLQSSQRSGDEVALLRRILEMLSCSTRVTDVKGWYKDDTIVGIIFTELGAGERGLVRDRLSTRLTTLLASILSAEQVDRLGVSFHFYPDDAFSQKSESPMGPPLYPDGRRETQERSVSRLAKRSMDIAGSVLALGVVWPIMLAASIAIRLTSKGPVVFRQERIGLGGRRFTFFKFRSMYDRSDSTTHEDYTSRLIEGSASPVMAGGRPVYKLVDDPRVTPLGRLLRRTSVDELPQLFNVLAGDMSLVGPRPAIPYEFDRYSIWHRQRLLSVKPGITGIWQVSGRGVTKFDEMIRQDIRYAKTWSVWLDAKILCQTVRVVLSGRGAY